MGKLTNPTKTQMIKMLDRRWGAFVKSQGKCENCGTANDLTWSHIIGRTYIKTRFDPRNTQCLCGSCHGKFGEQPTSFARWVESTTCGQYVDTMIVQSNNASVKPDYELWMTLYEAITMKELTVEQSREFLGDQIMLTIHDINLLDEQ